MFDPHAAYSKVEQLIYSDQNEAAHEALIDLIGKDDQFTLAYLALSRVCTKLGRHLEAVEYGQKACQLEPSDPFNFSALSVTCQRAWAGTQDRKFIQMAEDAMAQANSLQGR